jgi:hypothetical protein
MMTGHKTLGDVVEKKINQEVFFFQLNFDLSRLTANFFLEFSGV